MHLFTILAYALALANCAHGSTNASAESKTPLTYVTDPSDLYVPSKHNTTTLLDLIRARPELTALSDALGEPAGFVNAFDTAPTWNFTFFAPSNTAFNNTGAYFSTWTSTPKGKWWLGNLITHHYIPNSALHKSSFNSTLSRLQTGTFLYLSAQNVGGNLTLNGVATVTEADIPVTNGVVHIIDHMLDPSAQIFEKELPKVSQMFIAGSCSNPQLPYC